MKELTWLFCHADGDCGMCSNFGAMVSAIILGPSTSGYDDPYSERVLQSVSRRRVVENAFQAMDRQQQKVLFSVLAGIRIHPFVDKVIGKKGAIAYLLMDPDKLERMCTKVASGDMTGPERISVSALKARTEKEYTKAMVAFLERFEGKR